MHSVLSLRSFAASQAVCTLVCWLWPCRIIFLVGRFRSVGFFFVTALFISVICECNIKIHENCVPNETQSTLSSRAKPISCICTLDMPAVRLTKTTTAGQSRPKRSEPKKQNKSNIFPMYICTIAASIVVTFIVPVVFSAARSLFSSGETISITLNSHSRLFSVLRCESAVDDWTIQCFVLL